MTRSSSPVVGVALAGGLSRRMGRDKARLEVGGVSLGELAVGRLRAVCAEVLLADAGRGSVPDVRSIADGPGAGPAAGLLAAAALRPESDLLVLACDLPRVPVALLERLAGRIAGDALVPRWRRGREPLCARYRPPALKRLAERVGAGRYALHRWLDVVEAGYLENAELARFGPPEDVFLNLNRPEDLDRLRRSPG